jgi:hypothetical protein
VFAAVFGKYGVPNDERGIFKSTDGGTTWKKVLFRDGKTAGADIWLDRKNPNVLYASLWEAFRNEYTMSSGGPGSGCSSPPTAVSTWTEITRNPGMPQDFVGRIGVSVSGADSSRVYAIVENENGGLFVSNDAGGTWSLVNSNRQIRQRAFYYSHVTADPVERDTVYLLNVGTFKSTDGGKTMSQFAGGDSHEIWINPNDNKEIMHASDSGGAITYTGGNPWTSRDYPTAQYYHAITTKHLPYHVCGAQQDGSTVCVTSEPANAAAAVAEDEVVAAAAVRGGGGGGGPTAYSPGGAEPAYIAPDPKDPGCVLLRRQQRLVPRLHQSPHGTEQGSPPVPAHVLGRALQRDPRTRAVDVSHRVFTRGPEHPVHGHPARLEDHEQRHGLDEDQRRPHASRSKDARALGRPDSRVT